MRNLILVALLGALSACSLVNKNWGEAPPPPKKIEIIAQTESVPANFILEGSEEQAVRATAYWRSEVTDLFSKIQGSKADELSDSELKFLVRKLTEKNNADFNLLLKKVFVIKSFLGFKDRLTKGDIQDLFNWIEKNGTEVRRLYQIYKASGSDAFMSEDYASGVKLLSTFLTRGDSKVPDTEFLSWVDLFLPAEYVNLRLAMPQVLAFAGASLESFCGSQIQAGVWEARKVGMCLSQVMNHFEPVLPWLNYALGKATSKDDMPKVLAAVNVLEDRLKLWLAQRQSPAFPLQKIVDLATATGIEQPDQFFKFMTWVKAFDPNSTDKKIRVEFFISAAHLIAAWHSSVLQDNIEGLEPKKAIKAILKKELMPYPKYPSFLADADTHVRLRLYQAIRDHVFSTFDKTETGEIQLDANNGGLVSLTQIAFRFLDGNIFFENLLNKLLEKGQPVQSFVTTATSHLNLDGLARVVIVAADLIVDDGEHYRSFWTKIKAHFDKKRDGHGLDSIDEPRLFAVLVTTDLLSSMTDRWSTSYPLKLNAAVSTVDRRSVVQNLRNIVQDEFPDLFEPCDFTGFSWSCGIVFNEVLPKVNAGTPVVNVSDMQTMALTGLLTQGFLRRCDRNDDGFWANSIINGYDEKDCVVAGIKSMVIALMDANLVTKDQKTIKLLNLVDSTEVFRMPLKIAMGRGTLKGIVWRIITSGFGVAQRSATVGTLFRLAGEFMNEDRAKALAGGFVGPVKDPGDEVLYTGELDE